MAQKDKPRGVLDGIGKSFVGLPHSFVLNTEEQGVQQQVRTNALIDAQTGKIIRQGVDARNDSQRAFFEIQGIRGATEAGAMALRGVNMGMLEANGHLSRMSSALEHGLPQITEGIGELQKISRKGAGLPENSRSANDLVRSGIASESETIILALGGGLRPEQEKEFYESLAPWKKDVIDSGLVFKHDPEMEKALTQKEKLFLAELRRKVSSGVMTFGSIESLAWNGALEENFHFQLSKNLRAARTGVVGVVHGLTEIAEQGDRMISQGDTGISQRTSMINQGNESLRLQRARLSQGDIQNQLAQANLFVGTATLAETKEIRSGVDTLVEVEKSSLLEHRANRKANETTAHYAPIIARGIAAQVYLAQRAEGHFQGIERNTDLLRVFAERGNEIATSHLAVSEASLEVERGIERNTAYMAERMDDLVEVGVAGLEISADISRSSRATAINTGSIATNTGELVDFAERADGFAARAEYARTIMVQQAAARNALLADIADGIDTGNYYQALTREAIANMDINIIQGLSSIAGLNVAQIQVAIRGNSLLEAMIVQQMENHIELRSLLESIEEGMERRHLSKNRANAYERFQEGLGKYRKGKIVEAIQLFDQSIVKWSNDHRVYFYRALSHILQDNAEKGEKDFKEALIWAEDDNPKVRAIIKMNLARLYYGMAKVYQEGGESELSDEKMLAAIITAREAEEETPDFYGTSFVLATYLAGFKLYEEARKILMAIIPKDPKLAIKMRYVPEFAPILDAFPNTLNEKIEESDRETINNVSVSIIKDCIEIGEFEIALECFRGLMQTGSVHLLRLRIWEIEELEPLHSKIIEEIIEGISKASADNSQNCYAMAMLALHFRTDINDISDFVVFDVFLKGTENDIDVRAKNAVAMKKKLSALSEEQAEYLLKLNTLHRKGLAWLRWTW